MQLQSHLVTNLTALSSTNKPFVEFMNSIPLTNYQLFKHPDRPSMNVLNKTTNKKYYEDDVDKQLDEDFSVYDLDNPKVAVFMGSGLGYHLKRFIDKCGSKYRMIFVFEVDPCMVKYTLAMHDFSSLLKSNRLQFITGIDLDQLYSVFNSMVLSIHELKTLIKTINIYPVDLNHHDLYINMFNVFKDAMFNGLLNHGNSPIDSLTGLENLLANINYTLDYPGIKDIKGSFKNKPAVLVAAGPSLKKNLHLLKGLEDKALIIGVDTSLRILLKNGIYPHIVTGLERGLSVLKYYENMEEYLPQLKDTYLATATVVRNEIYKKCVDEYGMTPLPCYRKFAHYEWLGVDKGTFNSGKSCANLAFNILAHLGCNPIILIGQDLAFGEGDITHHEDAGHSITGMLASPKIKDTLTVKGNYVEQIKTTRTWYSFLRSYEQDIRDWKANVYNCTEGGAFIQGTKLDTFENVIKKFIINDIKPFDMLKKNLAAKFNDDVKKRDYETVRAVIKKTEAYNVEAYNVLDNGIAAADSYNPSIEYSDAEIESIYNVVMLNYKSLIGNVQYYQWVMHVSQSQVLQGEVELNLIPSRFATAREQQTAAILHFKEWFKINKALVQQCEKHLTLAKEKVGLTPTLYKFKL